MSDFKVTKSVQGNRIHVELNRRQGRWVKQFSLRTRGRNSMSQHDYQKYERAKVKNFPDVFLMAFCSILVSWISYPWVDAKWNVLAGKK